MFDQWTYLLYTIIFTMPFTIILWFYYHNIVKQHIRAILATTIVLTIYGFMLWPTGLAWGTWAYNSEKILGLTIFGTILEDIVWWLLISLLISSFAAVLMTKEEKKEDIFKRE